MPDAYILLSTGQNVSNLPPLLANAEVGDTLLWLESGRARAGHWIDGAAAVLEQRGFHDQRRLAFNDTPDSLHQTLAGYLRHQLHGHRLTLIGNGGSKLQSMAAWEAIRGRRGRLIYGLDQPVAWQCLPEGPGGPLETHSYRVAPLRLVEILRCSGHHCLAPPPNLLDAGQSAPAQPIPGYAEDPQITGEAHDRAWQREQHRLSAEQAEPPHYDRLSALLPPARLARWAAALVEIAHAYRRAARPAVPPQTVLQQLLQQRPTLGRGLYHATLKLAREATIAAGAPPPGQPLGPAFEAAVAQRVLAWLDGPGRPCRALLSGVHCGVSVAHEHQPQRSTAEFDLLLVLRNGILWNLECKSFDATQKDLDARIANLHLAGSRLARMAVVSPLYTAFADRPWFGVNAELVERLHAGNGSLRALPLDLPGQPPCYLRPGHDGDQTEHPVTRFEDGLQRLLNPYLPASPT